jgi:hypothetical protein
VGEPVEAKAESVAIADDDSNYAKADSLNGSGKDHESVKAGDMTAGIDEPTARSGSAKSVAKDHESTTTEGITDVGVEETKARSKSARSVPEETGMAEAESVMSREGVADTVGEGKAKASSDD